MRFISALLLGFVCLLPVGCSFTLADTAAPTSALSFTGRVHGGQQPVSGTRIYLYAAATSGNGVPSVSLLHNPGYVTTGDQGQFSITSDYTCSPADQLYLLALGGNPGLPNPSTDNQAIALVAALGPCSGLNSDTIIIVNEVTTVAAAYALSGYITSATTLSSDGSTLALQGLTNAFLTANNLANTTSGQPRTNTPAGNGIVPTQEINSLADALAACVNTNGDTSPGAACQKLFTATTVTSSTPTDTFQAVLNLAHNPGLSPTLATDIGVSNGPFQPTLPAAPNDWSLAISYTGGGLLGSYYVAVDSLGDVWFTNTGGSAMSLTQLDPAGNPFSPSTGYTGSALGDSIDGIALDTANNAWIGTYDSTLSTPFVAEITHNGSILSGPGYTTPSLQGPGFPCFDPAGNLWVLTSTYGAQGGNFVAYGVLSEFDMNGNPISSASGDTGGGLATAYTIACDATGNVWAGNFNAPDFSDGVSLAEFNSSGNPVSSDNGYTGGGLDVVPAIAIDHQGNIWAVDAGTSALSKFNLSGNPLSPTAGYSGPAAQPAFVAVDGAGNIWSVSAVGQPAAASIAVNDNSGNLLSPPTGFQSSALNQPTSIAIDGSGNLWVANFGPRDISGNGTATNAVEFVGLATPVVTPLAQGTATNQLGVRP